MKRRWQDIRKFIRQTKSIINSTSKRMPNSRNFSLSNQTEKATTILKKVIISLLAQVSKLPRDR